MNSALEATAQGDDYCEYTSLKATLLLHYFCLTLSLPPRDSIHFQEIQTRVLHSNTFGGLTALAGCFGCVRIGLVVVQRRGKHRRQT